MPRARISLTLSRHFSLSFIASGRSSELHPVSSHSCCMYVRAGRPALALPYVGVHRRTSLMSSSLLLQQCPACLVRLTWIVFMIGGKWPYSWCLVGCCRQDLCVCVSLCVCVCVCVCISGVSHAHLYRRIHVRTNTHIHAHTHTHTYIYIYKTFLQHSLLGWYNDIYIYIYSLMQADTQKHHPTNIYTHYTHSLIYVYIYIYI